MTQPSLIVPEPVYRIKDMPGFEDLEFSPASEDYLNHPDAIEYRPEFGGSLASADEVLAFRFAANGVDDANKYHGTRTATFRFVKDGRVLVAADDSPNLEENILLQEDRVKQGFALHSKGREWLVSLKDPAVAGAIERATAAGRVYQAFDVNDRALAFDGTYRQDVVVRALIPRTAEKNEQYLRKVGFKTGYTWDLTAKQANDRGASENTVLVRRVGVGGGVVRDNLSAVGQLYFGGLARWVRKKYP